MAKHYGPALAFAPWSIARHPDRARLALATDWGRADQLTLTGRGAAVLPERAVLLGRGLPWGPSDERRHVPPPRGPPIQRDHPSRRAGSCYMVI